MTLVGFLVLVPVALTLPFALQSSDGLEGIVDYRGIPGYSGLATLAGPGFALFQLAGDQTPWISSLGDFAFNHTSLLLGVPLAAVGGVLLWRGRARPSGRWPCC